MVDRAKESDDLILDKRQQAAAGGGVAAVIPTATAVKQTLVYVVTTVAGVVQTVQVPYTQTFAALMTVPAVVSAGVIGMPTGALATASASGAVITTNSLSMVVQCTSALFFAITLGFLI